MSSGTTRTSSNHEGVEEVAKEETAVVTPVNDTEKVVEELRKP